MMRWLLSRFRRRDAHVCASEKRMVMLRSLAAHVGRPQLHWATDQQCVEAVVDAFGEIETRAFRAEARVVELEQAWRDVLSLQLGAQVPATMPVEPDVILRQMARNKAVQG